MNRYAARNRRLLRHLLSPLGLALAGIIVTAGPAPAQPGTNEPAAGITGADIRALTSEVELAVQQVKTNLPDLLNQGLAGLTVSNSPLAWLQALNLQFKAFEPGASGQDAGLGVDYSYDKAVTDAQLFGEDNPAFLTFNLKARGTVSFDKDNNPTDFLQTGAQLHLWQYFGQTEQEKPGADGLTLSARTHRMLAKPPFDQMSGNQIRNSPEYQAYRQHAYELEPSDFFYDLAANLALESNQTFATKQWAYGLEFQPRFRSWNPNSPWSRFNFFDWPFAFTRMITERKWQPRGWFLPSVMAGIDLVDPVGNSERFAADPDGSPYPRAKAEVAFRSKVLEWEDGRVIWFNAGYRYFHEVNASAAIKGADLDTQHFFAASLDFPLNFSLTYSAGKLPFDQQDQQVWALGYRFKF